jgi:predicted phosphodiesterase
MIQNSSYSLTGLFALGCSMFLLSCGFNSNQQTHLIEIDTAQGLNPWSNLNWNNQVENFQFVVVTDRTGGLRPGVFEQGVEKVNLLQPEFVMSVGDLIQGYTDDLDELNRQWDEFDGFVDGLEMPFFYVPGNHDFTNKTMEDLWTERYGRSYYHFVYQNALFLCLNSEEAIPEEGNPEGIYHTSDFYLSAAQRAYIKETLSANSEVRWTFVFWHKPVWLYQDSDNPTHQELVPKSGWPEVEALLKERKHTVFAGHIHRYVHQKRNNSDYITLATTGGGSALGGPIFGQFDHVLWVTMTDDGPVMANLLLEGIFDEDFSKEDIQKHLELTLRHKSLRVDSKFDDNLPPDFQSIKLTLFNHHDIPVMAKVAFTSSENILYSENLKSVSIPPNSAASIEVAVKLQPVVPEDINSDLKDPLWGELKTHNARWTFIYDFEKHGQIEINGTKSIY